jgi:hypothetical protein
MSNEVKRLLIIVSFAFILCCADKCAGADRQDQSDAAHFGMSFILDSAIYAGFRHIGVPRLPAEIFSGVLAASIGAYKEMHDFEPSGRDMNFNLLGIATSKVLRIAIPF